MSQTPETDSVMKNCNGWHHVPIEFARKLERERDEAAESLRLALECVVFESRRATEATNERDQLRAVCDELAAAHCQRTGIDGAFDSCLVNYRNLHHVKARKRK